MTSRHGDGKMANHFFQCIPFTKIFRAFKENQGKFFFQRKKNELINFLYGLSVRSAHEQTSKKKDLAPPGANIIYVVLEFDRFPPSSVRYWRNSSYNSV